MALEFSTVGAKVYVGIETSAGIQPETFYEIPNVSEAPEIALDTEALDCSDITDTITRYILGRQDPGGTIDFTLNLTDAVIGAWNNLVKAVETARGKGQEAWFIYYYNGCAYGFFFTGIPTMLGTSGISQNEVATTSASVITTAINGWLTLPEGLTSSGTLKADTTFGDDDDDN
ncbi:MAG: hypothetical protein LUD47_06785 [Clostridia bacterium]|nr:hypothetical protein [Clostridia bacterium]